MKDVTTRLAKVLTGDIEMHGKTSCTQGMAFCLKSTAWIDHILASVLRNSTMSVGGLIRVKVTVEQFEKPYCIVATLH